MLLVSPEAAFVLVVLLLRGAGRGVAIGIGFDAALAPLAFGRCRSRLLALSRRTLLAFRRLVLIVVVLAGGN